MSEEKRRRWIAFWRDHAMDDVPFPDDLRGLKCGAMTKAGAPCKQIHLVRSNGRCKFHGGLSTGPKSEAGKEQARVNGRKGGRPRTEAHGEFRISQGLAIRQKVAECELPKVGVGSAAHRCQGLQVLLDEAELALWIAFRCQL